MRPHLLEITTKYNPGGFTPYFLIEKSEEANRKSKLRLVASANESDGAAAACPGESIKDA